MPYDRSAAHIFGIFWVQRVQKIWKSDWVAFLGFWVLCSFLVSSCSFLFLVLGLGFKRGGRFLLIFGAWVVFLVFGVLLVPSLLFLVHFFLLVLGLGFRGGFFLFWGPGWCSWGLGFFWCLLVPFLFFFLFLSSSWWPGWVSWGLWVLLVIGGLPVFAFSCSFFFFLFFSSWFFLFLSCSFLVPFLFLLVSSCFFLFLLFLFWGAWVVFLGFGVFLAPSLFVILVPFLLVWGAWVVFLGFGGSSCSCLVSSCSISSCFGGRVVFLGFGGSSCSFLVSSSRRRRWGERNKTRPVVWGLFLLLSCFF